ncbi:MAG TPA: adenylate/guanylate cyclase domain-containing protein [Xanthobacteraceae bacterium]|nr:adenylate/guanylate cyclase domain-containing protein [Xanthobacteraceae bacterium]
MKRQSRLGFVDQASLVPQFWDVVGSSTEMEFHPLDFLERLTWLRESVIYPLVAEHRGTRVRPIGDGDFFIFHSAMEAIKCAISAQTTAARMQMWKRDKQKLKWRVGTHRGDVLIVGNNKNRDYYGDAVNVAARLQTVAPNGGIAISSEVYRDIQNRLGMPFDKMRWVNLGEKTFHSITRPIGVHTLAYKQLVSSNWLSRVASFLV